MKLGKKILILRNVEIIMRRSQKGKKGQKKDRVKEKRLKGRRNGGTQGKGRKKNIRTIIGI